MEALKKRLKSKTYWAGISMAILTIVEANQQIIASLLPPKYHPYTPLIFPIVMLALREVTTSALADK